MTLVPDGFAPTAAMLGMVAYVAIQRIRSAGASGQLMWEVHANAESTLLARGEGGQAMDALLAVARLATGVSILWSVKWKVSSTHSHFILTRADGSDFVLRGPMIALTFTVWCWTLQGLYFSMTGSLGVVRLVVGEFAFDTVVPQLVHKFLWVVFEQSFSCAFLVFVVVWFVLVPATRLIEDPARRKHALGVFFSHFVLAAHALNAVLMLIEVLVNRLTFCKEHWSFVVLFGIAYVCPAWAINLRYDVWFYFFFEPRGRPLAPLVYLGLACTLAGFFALGHEVSHALKPQML